MYRLIVFLFILYSSVSVGWSASPAIQPFPDDSPGSGDLEFQRLNRFDPALWRIHEGGQAAWGEFPEQPSNDSLLINFRFDGREGLEYLCFSTPLSVPCDGLYLGIKATAVDQDGAPYTGSLKVRLQDRSGETHQIGFGLADGQWRYAKIASSECWGGDGDRVLQTPCFVETIVLDKAPAGLNGSYKGTGTLTLHDFQIFRKKELQDLAALSPRENLPVGNVFPIAQNGESKSVQFNAAAKESFHNSPIGWKRTDQVNGQPVQTTRVDPLNVPLPTVGFQRTTFYPTVDQDGKPVLGRPLQFAFASIADGIPANPWFGVCTHFAQGWNQELIQFPQRIGIGMIRDEMSWGRCEQEKGVYKFDQKWDDYIDRSLKGGIEPLVVLDYSNPLYDNNDFPHTDEGISAFASYAAAIASHFKGRVRYFEVWNEWSGACGMGHAKDTGSNSPENYVKLLAATAKAMRKINPNVYIIGGGGEHYTWHFPQIEAMLKAGAMRYCDAFSVHPYISPHVPEKVAMLQNMRKIADCMKANGCENPKLWLTELGWPTDRACPGSDRELFQAQMLIRSVAMYKSMSEVERYIWYDLKNDGTDPGYNEHNFGLIRNDEYGWQPKPAFVAAAVFNQYVGDQTVTFDKSLSVDSLYVCRTKAKDGKAVLIVWSELPEQEIRLPREITVLRQIGLYGEPVATENRKAGQSPIYMIVRE